MCAWGNYERIQGLNGAFLGLENQYNNVITPRTCARGKVISHVVVVVVSTKIAISRDVGV